MLKTIIEKLKRKKDNDVNVDVLQLEYSNNKCYVSALNIIYIYIYICEYSININFKSS